MGLARRCVDATDAVSTDAVSSTLCLDAVHVCIRTCEAHVAAALSANAQHGACAPPAYTLAVHVPALKASHVPALKASHVKALKASHVTKA